MFDHRFNIQVLREYIRKRKRELLFFFFLDLQKKIVIKLNIHWIYRIELLKCLWNENIFFSFYPFSKFNCWTLNSQHRDCEIFRIRLTTKNSIELKSIQKDFNFKYISVQLGTKQNAFKSRNVSVQMKRNGIFHIIKDSEDSFLFYFFFFSVASTFVYRMPN